MATPTIIDIPHTLGRAEARRRIAARIGDLPAQIPGGAAEVHAVWPAEDRLALDVTALGQTVAATVDVGETMLHVSLLLPPMLSFFSGKISEVVARKAGKLLLGPPA